MATVEDIYEAERTITISVMFLITQQQDNKYNLCFKWATSFFHMSFFLEAILPCENTTEVICYAVPPKPLPPNPPTPQPSGRWISQPTLSKCGFKFMQPGRTNSMPQRVFINISCLPIPKRGIGVRGAEWIYRECSVMLIKIVRWTICGTQECRISVRWTNIWGHKQIGFWELGSFSGMGVKWQLISLLFKVSAVAITHCRVQKQQGGMIRSGVICRSSACVWVCVGTPVRMVGWVVERYIEA